jgi:tetratricopeptide (TPR) repeat protein
MIYLILILWVSLQVNAANSCRDLLDSGDLAYEQFDNSRALGIYSRARNECPDFYEPLFKRTRALIDHGEDLGNKEGKRYLEQGLKSTDTMRLVYPDSLQTWFLRAAASGNLARLAGGKQKVAMARTVESSARKAIGMDTSYAPAYVILGGYYYEVATAGSLLKGIARLLYGGVPEGTLEDSERMLRTALKLQPDNIYAHFEISRTLQAMGREREAREHLKTVLQLPVTSHQDKDLKTRAQRLLRG